MIAITNELYSSEITCADSSCEILFVKAWSEAACKILICAAYIPPQSPPRAYEVFVETVTEIVTAHPDFSSALIVGDFNIPHFNWSGEDSNHTCPSAKLLLDLSSFLGVHQISSVKNDRGVQLDLVFGMPEHFSVSRAEDPLLPPEACHPALCISTTLPSSSQHSNSSVYVRNINRCNIDGVRQDILNGLIGLDLECEDVNLLFAEFCAQISNSIERHSPMKRIGRTVFPKWFSSDLKNLVILKKSLHAKYKRTLSEADYFAFQLTRDQCKALTTKCRASYVSYVDASIGSNIKIFWSFVKNLKSKSSTPNLLKYGTSKATLPHEMSNLFATYFSSVFTPASQDPIDKYDYKTTFTLSKCSLSLQAVSNRLRRLDESKGSGPDGITHGVLKHCYAELAPLLQFLFNLSLSKGIFPDSLKDGFVIPIFKSGDPQSATNYRPIVIQSVLGKVFEGLVLDIIQPFFSNLIIEEQHGFTPGKSTVTNLLTFQWQVLDAFAAGHQVDAIYIDFSKAFDKISHRRLLAKLEGYGIVGELHSWFRTYLENRSLSVRFATSISPPFIATSGVPQGSHLGPLLFSIYINDIKAYINNPFQLFADDIKLFKEITIVEDCISLQQSLDSVLAWCSINEMSVNPTKTKTITFSRKSQYISVDYLIDGALLERCSSISDLGVMLTSSFDFGLHIDNICSRASRQLGLITRTARHGLGVSAVNYLYKSLVRQLLEYASPVWSPYVLSHITRLQAIQRRFVRLLGCRMGLRYREVPVSDLEEVYGLQSLQLRRNIMDLVFLYKLLNSKVHCPFLLEKINIRARTGTRSQHLFELCFHGRNYLLHSPVPRMLRLGNTVCSSVDFFCDSMTTFKRLTIEALVERR